MCLNYTHSLVRVKFGGRGGMVSWLLFVILPSPWGNPPLIGREGG